MKALAFTFGLLLLASNARAADTDEHLALTLSQRAGLVTAPFVTAPFPEASGFGLLLTAAAAYRHSSLGWFQLELPLGFVWVDQPAGSQLEETVVGNLELALAHPLELSRATHLSLVGALAAPTAEHGSEQALLANRALAIASALNGGQDSPLLTPGVLGVRLGASLEHSLPPFDLRASLDLPVLFRVTRASLPSDTGAHPIGFLPALRVGAEWWPIRRFGASLSGGLVTELVRVQEPVRQSERDRRVQPFLEPGVHTRLGQHLRLGLQGSIPVAGNLGGDAFSLGIDARLAL